MKCLAVLQNQWVKDPVRVKKLYADYPDQREHITAQLLFMGGRTGQRLEQLLGDLIDEIIWEEASPEIGGYSSAAFPADIPHIVQAIRKHQPSLIFAFGKIAAQGCFEAMHLAGVKAELITAPHPAARRNEDQKTLESQCAKMRQSVEGGKEK